MQLTVKEFKQLLAANGVDDSEQLRSITFLADDDEGDVGIIWTESGLIIQQEKPFQKPFSSRA
jgi:hypothetical protein